MCSARMERRRRQPNNASSIGCSISNSTSSRKLLVLLSVGIVTISVILHVVLVDAWICIHNQHHHYHVSTKTTTMTMTTTATTILPPNQQQQQQQQRIRIMHQHRNRSRICTSTTAQYSISPTTRYLDCMNHRVSIPPTETAASISIALVPSSSSSSPAVLCQSPVLGDLRRIRLSEDDEDDSFLGAMGVPTFAAVENHHAVTAIAATDASNRNTVMLKQQQQQQQQKQHEAEQKLVLSSSARHRRRLGLEGALSNGHGPAFVVEHVLSKDVCEQLIQDCEQLGFAQFSSGKNYHGAQQIIVDADSHLSNMILTQVTPYIDVNELQQLRTDMMKQTTKVETDDDDHSDDNSSNTDDVRLYVAGLNRRWRIYKYDNTSGEESFAPHIDAGFPPSGVSEDGRHLIWDDSASYYDTNDPNGTIKEIVSRLTVLIYLNEDFIGGETKFYPPLIEQQQQRELIQNQNRNVCNANNKNNFAAATAAVAGVSPIAAVKPRTGSVLIFPQGVGEDAVEYARHYWPTHEGSKVLACSSQSKYVIRSDILFATHVEPPPFIDENDDNDNILFRYDNIVRQTFLPKQSVSASATTTDAAATTTAATAGTNISSNMNSVWDKNFLSQPCMGVENLGPFLYSFLRMTKKKTVVEIGAGYTTLWILQALKDNDIEMESILALQRSGQCKLLNIPWTIHKEVEKYCGVNSAEEPPISSTLICIDNCEHQKETASGALAVSKSLGLDRYLQFQNSDAFDMELEPSSVDVLWCDFGVGSRMKDFLSSNWDCIKPGGYMLCHSTVTNENTRRWLEGIRSRLPKATTGIEPDQYVELSLLEHHKRFQNSVTILQKRESSTAGSAVVYREPIYSQYA